MEEANSQSPLLSPAPSSDGPDERQRLYGASASKSDVSVAANFIDDEAGPEPQNGIQQADAINLVWTRTALVLAYSL